MGNHDLKSRLAASREMAEALRVDPARAGTLRLADALAEPRQASEGGESVDSLRYSQTPPPIVVRSGKAAKSRFVLPPAVENANLSTNLPAT